MSYPDCIEACLRCMRDCTICLNEMAGTASDNDCPKCCIECIDICDITAKALIRNSKYTVDYLHLCAKICDWCAKQCGAHENDHCQACAESCRKCAAMCQTGVAA